MPTQDQVAWANCNITTGGATKPFPRGDLLPAAVGDDEQYERTTLRLIGAIRTVEVVYSDAELAGQARDRGEQAAVRAAVHDPGPVPAVTPVLETPGAAPVVIGPEPGAKTEEKPKTEDKPAQS